MAGTRGTRGIRPRVTLGSGADTTEHMCSGLTVGHVAGVDLLLDGRGKADVSTTIPLLDRQLADLAAASGISFTINAVGAGPQPSSEPGNPASEPENPASEPDNPASEPGNPAARLTLLKRPSSRRSSRAHQ
eukprot:5258729-Pyramimonas_sp.AAC.1